MNNKELLKTIDALWPEGTDPEYLRGWNDLKAHIHLLLEAKDE